MATPREYEDEVKREHDRYGAMRRAPGTAAPVGAIEVLIAELSIEITEASHRLSMARATFIEASRGKQDEELHFAELADRLMSAIHEHREGTPENVPYRP
jgi:hypothetical protein